MLYRYRFDSGTTLAKHHISPPLEKGEASALCGARVFCPFTMVVGMEKFGATGGASSSPTKSE